MAGLKFLRILEATDLLWWLLFAASIGTGFIFAYFLPRRTAWGHALYRQAVGLKFFLGEGKWRYEIAEKNLFLEEVLPLAVSLKVVDKLSKDMQDLGIQQTTYLSDVSTFNLIAFQNSMGSAFVAGSRSGWGANGGGWSGGSGFSGGFSGGGFGGGGGGSW